MTSERMKEVYVWCWLPGATEPVVAGLITRDGERHIFNYGRSYLERKAAIPLYEPELPLRRGTIPPLDGLTLAGCLRRRAGRVGAAGHYQPDVGEEGRRHRCWRARQTRIPD